ncbi:MAG: tRNA (adenosine(37)-N6)-threonylcarbamoyltransferase complex dimerization subunit type 1 TsaB, partial [Microbacterium gubbeenense]
MILAIDSSIGSTVAVVDPATDAVLADCSSDVPRGHAEVIGTLIERALDDAAVSPADITHVAAGMGPGPFTGLRIGIAAARAFAVGRGIPVVPVVSHDAAALEILTRD